MSEQCRLTVDGVRCKRQATTTLRVRMEAVPESSQPPPAPVCGVHSAFPIAGAHTVQIDFDQQDRPADPTPEDGRLTP